MIDLHCHLLPGLDDGALTWEESLELARNAADQGVRRIVATPHHANGRYDNPADRVLESTWRINRFLQEHHLPLDVLPGQEIRIYPQLLDDLEKGRLLPLGDSRYLLLELPDEWQTAALMDLFHELKLLGYSPIIAHPERHYTLMKNPEILAEFVEFGVLGQVTAPSLIGSYGHAVRRSALQMCREGLIHLLASDAHRPRKRGFALEAAYGLLDREVGAEYSAILRTNSLQVVQDEKVQAADQLRKQRKAWFI